jgi:spermidine synthase
MPVLHDAAGGLRWITVTEENGTRYIYLDGCEEGAMALDSEAPVFHYLWFHKLSHLIGLPLRRALVLGAGAFTAAKCLAIDYPDAVIDAVDEEPELEAIARRFFRLDQPQFGRIRFHPVPAEQFLAGPAGHYEFIFDDLFDGDQHVPIAGRGEDHVARLRSILANGLCVKNLIWSPRSADSRAACAEAIQAFGRVFPQHRALTLGDPTGGHNVLAIGLTTSREFDWEQARASLLAAGVPDMVLENAAVNGAGDHDNP